MLKKVICTGICAYGIFVFKSKTIARFLSSFDFRQMLNSNKIIKSNNERILIEKTENFCFVCEFKNTFK